MMGALRNFVQLSDSPFSAEGVSFAMSLIVVLAASRPTTISFDPTGIVSLPKWLLYLFVFFCTALSFYTVAVVGIDQLISYTGYGSIKGGEGEAANASRIVGSMLRLSTVVLIPIALTHLLVGRNAFFLAALPAILTAIVVGFSEASRITAIYFAIAAISAMLLRRKVLTLCAIALTIFSVGYSLEARSHNTLGLQYLAEYAGKSFETTDLLLDVAYNVAAWPFVTAAVARSGSPDKYTELYKVLSFLPTVDAIDGFQAEKLTSEQRILAFVPFNSFGEAWLFGPVYFCAFWFVLVLAAYLAARSSKYGGVWTIFMSGLFIVGWVFASQYPIRNSLRYFYLIILVYSLIPTLSTLYMRRKSRFINDVNDVATGAEN
ncbi:hypothetical protein [Devosia sp.]|uniref:hypothetical protein n=1 Tax=Devosia sp. TaxID=1871048 RepID=UPI003BAB30D6